MPSNRTAKPWDPDPYGMTEFELWEKYRNSVDAFHADWVRNDPTRKSGYVYVLYMWSHAGIRPESGALVHKIGMSRNPQNRLKEIQRSSVKMPYSIELQHTYFSPDMARAERLMHTMLHRYRTSGEWFILPAPIWHVLYDLWYIAPHSSLTELEFRNSMHGGWFTPHDFFQVHIEDFHRMNENHRGTNTE